MPGGKKLDFFRGGGDSRRPGGRSVIVVVVVVVFGCGGGDAFGIGGGEILLPGATFAVPLPHKSSQSSSESLPAAPL